MSIYGPGKTTSRARDTTQDLRIYAKKSYVNAETISRGGDRMLGILDMNGFAVRNLPEVHKQVRMLAVLLLPGQLARSV